MGKTLVITEKPSVAREYASILNVKGRSDGYIEDDRFCITWCVGHLIEMCYPEKYDEKYKRWRMEDLPFLPSEYKYDVISNVKKQYGVVKKMLHRDDIETVLWAGDSGREGQVIEELIRRQSGVRKGMTEKRVWIDSTTEEEIKRGINEAKPYSEYDNLSNAGIMRGIEDYSMGINFSRALSVKYGRLLNEAAGTKKYSAIAVGRVMTCVLGMVVRREREIRGFKETVFYRIRGTFSVPEGSYGGEWKVAEGSSYLGHPGIYNEKGFLSKEEAESFIEALGKNSGAVIKSIKKMDEKKKPPLLFNLAELQAACSKRFHISPDETLNSAQELYEKKLTTYPRTDARVLTKAVAVEIIKNLKGVSRYTPLKSFVEKIISEGLYKNIVKKPYTDDSKVTDHYAIIPTGNLTEYNRLSDISKKIYDMIVRRFLSIFYPPAVFKKVSLITTVALEKGAESFFTSSKALIEPGFFVITGQDKKYGEAPGKTAEEKGKGSGEEPEDEEEENDGDLLKLIPVLKKSMEVKSTDFFLKEGKTAPPKRYTTGSMILAMENAGQLIEDEELRAQIKGAGIGTSATRAGILEKLVHIRYLNLNKKNQILTPGKLGEMVYEVVYLTMPGMLNPEMTASWEKGLSRVEGGELTPGKYRETLDNYVRKYVESVRSQDLSPKLSERFRVLNGMK